MRLGAWPCRLQKGTLAAEAYGTSRISERHRHRWEVNPKYHDELRKYNMVFSGMSPDNRLVEIIEIKDHPWFVATQAHPEFQSRPQRAHPLFREFIKASKEMQQRMEDLTPGKKRDIPLETNAN